MNDPTFTPVGDANWPDLDLIGVFAKTMQQERLAGNYRGAECLRQSALVEFSRVCEIVALGGR